MGHIFEIILLRRSCRYVKSGRLSFERTSAQEMSFLRRGHIVGGGHRNETFLVQCAHGSSGEIRAILLAMNSATQILPSDPAAIPTG